MEVDVMKEHRRKAAKPLLWVAMVSMVMLFAGLTSGYVVRRAEGNWLEFDLPITFTYATIVLLLSSLTMAMASLSARKSSYRNVSLYIFLTLILGLVFAALQWNSWGTLVDSGVYFTGPGSNAAGSFFYVITLAHLVHLIGGLLVLLFMLFRSFKKAYNAENLLGLQLGSTFWHFLDILWIYLFLFLLFIR